MAGEMLLVCVAERAPAVLQRDEPLAGRRQVDGPVTVVNGASAEQVKRELVHVSIVDPGRRECLRSRLLQLEWPEYLPRGSWAAAPSAMR